VRSVEFHPEAQDEFISAAQFYESQTAGLGNDCSSFLPPARRLAAGSGVFWFRRFPAVSCIVSSLSGSTSWQSCTFTVDPATGGHGSETMLPKWRWAADQAKEV